MLAERHVGAALLGATDRKDDRGDAARLNERPQLRPRQILQKDRIRRARQELGRREQTSMPPEIGCSARARKRSGPMRKPMWVAALSLVVVLAVAPRNAVAESFLDLFAGAAFTESKDLKLSVSGFSVRGEGDFDKS